MKRALAVIFFLMSDSFVFSQNSVTIIGKVINEKSGEALPYATISIAHSSYGTVSNEYGEFELKVPFHLINDTLMISYLGFRLYKEKITAQTEYRVFKLEEASTVLDDVLVKDKKLTAEDILYKAIDKLLERSDLQDFRLEGFYREVHSANNRVIGLIEAAFSIYDNSCTHPMQNIEVEEFRKVVSEELSNVPSKQLYKHNNLMMLFGTSTNFVVLGRQGLKNGKTTWAIGKRPYTIESISSYNDRPVYVISHVNETTSLRIIIDADDFSVLRNEYHSKQSINDYKNYFWKYSGISESTCGFYETRQVYEYYEFQGMIYPRIFHRTDYSACFDSATKRIKNTSIGNYEALISSVVLNSKPPFDLKSLKKHKGLTKFNYEYHPDFWSNYTIIKDLPLDESTLKQFGGYDNLNRKFK